MKLGRRGAEQVAVPAQAEMTADAMSVGEERPGTIWVMGGPKISRQENVEVVSERVREEVMRYLDEGRGSPSQVLEFIQGLHERLQRQFGRAPPFVNREETLNCFNPSQS